MRCEICNEDSAVFSVIPDFGDGVTAICPSCGPKLIKFAKLGKMLSELPVGSTYVVTREGVGLSSGKVHAAGKNAGEAFRVLQEKQR